MYSKAKHIEASKLRFISSVLGKGGDNFRWVGVGRVKVTFLGRPSKKVKDEVCANVCDRAVFPTLEEVRAEVGESNSRIKQTVTAMNACMADAKVKGLKRGNGGKDSIPCPVCKTGRLHYSVSGYNGNLWGQCDSKDCVSWMQ
jgi:hypothetical protein